MLLSEAVSGYGCTRSAFYVDCCSYGNPSDSLDNDAYKLEGGLKPQEGKGDVCRSFSIQLRGACYNDEARNNINGGWTYDYCYNSSSVVECFMIGHAGDGDDSVTSSSASISPRLSPSISCPANYICTRFLNARGAINTSGACIPKRTCTSTSNCDPCMSCVNNYCEYNNSMSCTGTGCTTGNCVCNWGLCTDAGCGSRINTYDCDSCTILSGNCDSCCDAEGETGGGYDCFPISHSCSERSMTFCQNFGLYCDEPAEKCCLTSETSGETVFTPKACSAIANANCNLCCPQITGPCEERTTQAQCTAETNQCGWCDDSCVNTTYSDAHCGGCNLPCESNEYCENSQCLERIPPCDLRFDQDSCINYGGSCSWCHAPAGTDSGDFSTYPYETFEDTFTCLNTSSDPFNCGSCGFNSAGQPTYSSAGGGFCSAATPFCINGNCVGRSGASCSAVTEITNPFYFYNVTDNWVYDSLGREDWSYFTYASQNCSGGNTGSVYSITDYDDKELICSLLTGGSYTFSDTLGCCGDNKCRVEQGTMCGVSALCDGTYWRSASDSNGEVFNASCSNYPIANINGQFIKCIDSDRYTNYSLLMNELIAQGIAACNLSNANAPIDYRLAGVLDYSCGNDQFSHSTIALLDGSDYCKMQLINTSSVATGGILVCTGWGNNAAMESTYGFVNILNRTVNAWNSSSNEYAQCPAPIEEWALELSPELELITSNPPLVMPCPGNKTITSNQIRDAVGISLYGGESPKAAVFCKPSRPARIESLSSLNYVSGSGTVMGTVNNRDYMCYTGTTGTAGNRARIAVCCGDQGCDASVGTAEQIATGGTILISGFRLACQPNGHWSSNLDSAGQAQVTCNSSGLFGTGTFCCSELDDNVSTIWTKESYNQPGGPGGCFRGTRQINNGFLQYNGVSYPNIYVINGSFYGCGFNAFDPGNSEFNQGDQALCQPDPSTGALSSECLHSIENWPDPGSDFSSTSARRTGTPLINRAGFCTGFRIPNPLQQGVYCDFTGNWAYTYGANQSHLSEIPAALLNYFGAGPESRSGCCDSTSCWTPSGCEREQPANAGIYTISDSLYYKCMQGEWVPFTSMKRTPDKCFIGFCPQLSQCLYRFANTTSAYFDCIGNGQYVNDYLCINGDWTSRTKILASKLINLTSSSTRNFVLTCGPPADVLINPHQSVGGSNNFCALYLDGQRIIGTTLNQPLYNGTNLNAFYNSIRSSFESIYQYMADEGVRFDFTCDESSTGFDASCMGGGSDDYLELYYDRTYQMVIFSDQPISGLRPTFGDTICNALPSWLQWLCPSPPALSQDLAGIKLFSKIYIAKNGTTKRVFGVKEDMCGNDIYSFNYTGYLKEELIPLVLYPDVNVFTNFTSDNTIYIERSNLIPWDPWAALTILRNLEHR